MRRAIAPLILLHLLAAGCEFEKDPADELLGPSLHLTDGYCLLAGERVVLNHGDIEHYDYGSHLIYLKDHISGEKLLEEAGTFRVFAGGEEIYTACTQPGYSSFAPTGPIIWTHPTFYEDNIIAIDLIGTYEVMTGSVSDSREDPRIVEVLKKYGQYREGLHCKIISVHYSAPDEAVLRLELSNRDEENYYYLDPEKMGIGLFHYFTNGLSLWGEEEHHSYTHQTESISPDPWDSWDLDWMSVLEGGSSVTLSLEYKNFEELPPGSYTATFMFPGLQYQVKREQIAQRHGQIWLGKLRLYHEVVVE